MDDVLVDLHRKDFDKTLAEFNGLHPNLRFTRERETERKTMFYDFVVTRNGSSFTTSWYSEPTDTRLTLGLFSDSPMKYKSLESA